MDDFVNIGEDFDLFEGGFDSIQEEVNSDMEVGCCEPRDDDYDDMGDCMLEFFLKAAKSRDTAYKGGTFPSSLLCNPYKYHLKMVGPLESNKISLRLVFADTHRVPQCDKNKTPVVLDNLNVLSPSKRVVKFSLHICSFHYRRKEFKLIVSCNGRDIYTSSSFRTYARRRSPPKKATPPSPQRVCRSPHSSTQVMPPPYGFPPQQQRQQQRFPVNPQNNRFNPQCAPRPPMVQPFPYAVPFNPYVNNFQQQQVQQLRASLAIQLLNSLNPLERRQVMMNCTGFSN